MSDPDAPAAAPAVEPVRAPVVASIVTAIAGFVDGLIPIAGPYLLIGIGIATKTDAVLDLGLVLLNPRSLTR